MRQKSGRREKREKEMELKKKRVDNHGVRKVKKNGKASIYESCRYEYSYHEHTLFNTKTMVVVTYDVF